MGDTDILSKETDVTELRSRIGMVFQRPTPFPMSIFDNIAYGVRLRENLSKSELEERVVWALQKAALWDDVKDKLDQPGTSLSGGQQQRLCIARALLKKPKILILDDSTSAVDTKTDALIRRAFAEEIPNTTKIIIAQRVSSVQEADQIVILDGGAVQAIGTHDELLADNRIYQEIYNQQNRKGGEE